jgi:hypothetical protein
MRAKEFIIESPEGKLAELLPSLKKHDYFTIDRLMQDLSDKYKITGKNLHDLFVNKYGDTPDDWIKKKKKIHKFHKQHGVTKPIKNVVETLSEDERMDHIQEFIRWCVKILNIEEPLPEITFSNDTEEAQTNHHTGSHHTDDHSIWIYINNRNLVDILRTTMHELVHLKQSQMGMIKPGDSYPGSPVEMLADMVAGKYIKVWGKKHPEIFQ